jgi:polyisoprenoid-binding protein YceI
MLAVMVASVSPMGMLAQEYHIDRTQTNKVTFFSRAPFEDIEGVTDLIDGYVVWQGGPPSVVGDHAGSELYFEVELDGLDTGIGLRDRHMRDNYLETGKFPLTTYAATIENVKSTGDAGFLMTARGTMSLHGVDREMEVGCEVTQVGESYRVSCSFDVQLSDYDIKVPSLMFMKISETISLEVVFFLVRAEQDV